MPTVSLRTLIDAPRERVFDLARSVETHTESMSGSNEEAVAGVTEEHLELDDTVTWRARHFGIPLEMTVAITRFDAPVYFKDEQIAGPFAALEHDHYFEVRDVGESRTESTVMRDEFTFRSPVGIVGRLVDRAVLTAYLKRLLENRNRTLKRAAEQSI